MPTPIRFHLDEHVPAAIAIGLRRRGVDVTTTGDAGLEGADDSAHIAFALGEGRVIVTHDRDFPRHHTGGVEHAGILYCYQSKYSIGDLLRAILLVHGCMSAEDLVGVLEYL
jgi:hypothetical protein